jgi:hypothetical protein
MKAKKKLITRMAVWAAAVLATAALVGGSALIKDLGDRAAWEETRKERRREVVERARAYLAELAKKIQSVPVDPAQVSEIEARYFEERDSGPLAVWAMKTDGAFLFGVPREGFARMNAIYDREITPRLKEGVFFDRQSFFLGHLDEGDAAGLLRELAQERRPNDVAELDLLDRLNRRGDWSGRSFVLSAPLVAADGTALGSLYLKRAVPDWGHHPGDERLRVLGAGSGGIAFISFIFLWLLLPSWVYVDARERGLARAPLFAFLTVISSLVGLVVYLIARPEEGRTLSCSGCGREVDGGAYCPHCGRDLSASICATCRYPLKADWTFCPSCRTEIKAVPPAAPSAPAV